MPRYNRAGWRFWTKPDSLAPSHNQTEAATLIRTKLRRAPAAWGPEVNQAVLVGMSNLLNGLGLPLVSVECLPPSMEKEASEQDDA